MGRGVFGARDHCGADITTANPKITNILERRSSPVIKDGAYEDITYLPTYSSANCRAQLSPVLAP